MKKTFKNVVKITVKFKGNDFFNQATASSYVKKILKVTGPKSAKLNEKINLKINIKKITVKFTIDSKKKVYKIKFNNRKCKFDISKYGFKKGKSYKLHLKYSNAKYYLKEMYKLSIQK